MRDLIEYNEGPNTVQYNERLNTIQWGTLYNTVRDFIQAIFQHDSQEIIGIEITRKPLF